MIFCKASLPVAMSWASALAQVLTEAGVVRNAAQAFKRYLGNGKPGDVKAFWPSFQVVRWIIEAGGVAVLPIPENTSLRQPSERADSGFSKGRGVQ